MNEELKLKLKVDVGDALAKIKQVKQAFADIADSTKMNDNFKNVKSHIDTASQSSGKLQSSLKGMSLINFGGVVASLKGVKTAQAGVAAATVASQAAVSKLAKQYKKEYDEMAATANAFKDKNSWVYNGKGKILDWAGEEEALANYNAHMTEAKFYLDNYNNEMAKAKKLNKDFSKSVKDSGSSALASLAKGAAIAVGAVAAVGAALASLSKNTLEYNREQAKLITAFQAVGASAEQAAESYNGLYRFLGDSGRSVEAANHLAKITTNQKDLAEWTKICQGIYATFGDSLPIEGLTEAANESLRVGKITGTLADALNWAGVSEDEFNAKLAATNSLSEREALLRSTLNDLYSNAADIYERNNAAIIAYNESQARLDASMAAAGKAVLPLITALNNLGAAFFTALKPALDVIIPPIAAFVNWIAKAIQSVMSFFSALTGKKTSVKAVADIGGATANTAKNLGGAADSAKNLGSGMDKAKKAADKAAKAVEEVKKQTMGFDELNILTSDKAASGSDSGSGSSPSGGGKGGGGGSGGAPGYAGGLVDSAAFRTEVDETEDSANSFAERLKKIFGDLKESLAPSIEAWSDAFDTVRQAWINAKPDFINGANEIKQGFMTLGNYLLKEFVPNVVNSFSVNLAPVIGDTLGFAIEETGKAFSWLGTSFNKTVNDIIIPVLKTIETVATGVFSVIGSAWDKYGANLLNAFSGTFKAIRGHLDNFYNSIFKPIFDKILVVFNNVWQNGLKPLYERAIEAIMVIGTELLNLYNKTIAPIVDWILTYIAPTIVKVVKDLIETAGEIFTAITNIVSGIIRVIEGIIQFLVGVFTSDWSKAWDGIKNIFGGFYEIFAGIIKALMAILDGLAKFIVNVVAAQFKTAWDAIKAVWGLAVNFFQNVWNGITKIFSVVGSWFSNIFSQAWTGVKNIWSNAGNWFGGIWNQITSVFGNVGGWFSGKFSEAWTAIKNVFSGWGAFFSGLWNTISSTFSKLGTSIGNAISGAVKSGINGVISQIERTINKAIGLINGAINLINKIPGVSVGKVSRLSLPRLAKGGIIDEATIAMIGERGKEAVVPLENNTEWMDKLADRIAQRNETPSKIVLMLDGKELGWANIHSINDITKQTGSLPLVVV